ncbi:antibiotic biosynthesis monooxygenase [Pedobacter ginsengisoli]|uniref:Antibiotic biosynthesis monooxygenase n=1 Tax=Pedobacter ginsengisoli TaxID=363852 RepID=A0A2D1U4M2_9SPHI|nr:putative quinol monooxygenase [Pedobacter ginsengisoli]ATP56556.1 antibiotic biosynthesis monooxygenase [Pedobacter ginsengisoli]
MSIYLTAISKAKPQHVDQFKALLLTLVVESRKEEACIQYDLHQSTDNPALFIFHEEWASKEALELHNQTAHIAKFIKDSVDIIDGNVTIHITEKLA